MDLPNRKLNRLDGYDYSSPGVYFVTICTKDRVPVLSTVSARTGKDGDAKITLTEIGKLACAEIGNIESHYKNVTIDKFVIMPNHIHLLIRITERINPFPTRYDISNVVGKFKAAVTRNVGKAFMPSAPKVLWQPSFYDHIIRSEQDYREIWEYIDNNPAKWVYNSTQV